VNKVVDEERKSWDQKTTKDKGTKRKKEEANLMEDESHTTTTEDSYDSDGEVNQQDLDDLDHQLEEVGLNDKDIMDEIDV
jgi:BRCT domain type II-containing protein